MYGPYNRSFVALPELEYVQFIKNMFSGYNVSLFGEKNTLIAVLFWFRIFIFSGRKKTVLTC